MMMELHASDSGQPRPNFAAYASGWSRTRLIPLVPLDPRLLAVAAAIATIHVNGGTKIAQFAIDAPLEVADYLAHNRIDPSFFLHFFAHPDVIAALANMPAPAKEALGFERRTGEQLLDTLAVTIMQGGAYRSFRGTEPQARALASQFAEAIGPRFFSAGGWISFDPWNAWFYDVAWDLSCFWFDRGTGIATVLLATDTD